MPAQRRKLSKRLRRSSRSMRAFASRLESATAVRPEPTRPRRSTAPVYALPPGESRYQRRSAKLPRGVSRFVGLDGDPQLTIDLTGVAPEEPVAEAG